MCVSRAIRKPLVSLAEGMVCPGEEHVPFLSKGSPGCILPHHSHSLPLGHVPHHGVSWVFFIRQSKSDDEVCRQATVCVSGSK